MNTNPNAKVVLCYGDSNTNGTKPDRSGCYAANERWTGLLQQGLGSDYYVIEEGLGGRSTDLDHPNPLKPSRDGFMYFKACFGSHAPLDVIIIMLGTNDVKTVYNRTAEDIVTALKQYPEYVKATCAADGLKLPKIVLVSPAYMDSNAPEFLESMPTPGIYDETSVQKVKEFAPLMEKLAAETGYLFLDVGPITKTGVDGCHLTLESHANVAAALKEIVEKLQ